MLFPTGCAPEGETRESLARQARSVLAQIDGRIQVDGLQQPVEVLRDSWGVPHIYANTATDLFFAQGFVAAQDRLFQMELWRRAGAGELAEVLGPDYVEMDRLARLMRYRGDMKAEWESYAPDARGIVEAFVGGINASIRHCGDRLPIEFRLLGFRPGEWQPEDCLLRFSALRRTRNIAREIARAEMAAKLGIGATMKYMPTDPPRELLPAPDLSLEGLDGRVLQAYRASEALMELPGLGASNNWVVDGTLTATGKPLLAVDPHQPVSLPSPRYVIHLVGPGWNVIGAGEPYLPGVARGHNETVAFGFTSAPFDQADHYVERTDPRNSRRYLSHGRWIDMYIERDQIRVKGRAKPVEVELRLTRHGPVIYEDRSANRAVSLRWVGSEPGTQVYLAALALDRARNWEDFLTAAERWKMPAENMVYADTEGNIGWLPAGLLPVRKHWSGLLPVPGHTGHYEWNGFRSVAELPRLLNPREHYIATANNNNRPAGYPFELGFDWEPPYRYRRIVEVLSSRGKFTVEDFERLQLDETSLPARELLAMLDEGARKQFGGWDGVVSKDSGAAALFEIWLRKLTASYVKLEVRSEARDLVARNLELPTLIALLKAASPAVRSRVLNEALEEALAEARALMGNSRERWRWGLLHQAWFRHPLAANDARRAVFDLGPVERGGDRYTVNCTAPGANFEQRTGPTYRQIIDLADWDRSVFINVPGQSGQPGSPYYANLLQMWAEGRYAPLLFSRRAVEEHTRHRLILTPE